MCSYVEKLGLEEPSDDILEVLTLHALNKKFTMKIKDLSTGNHLTTIISHRLIFFFFCPLHKIGCFFFRQDNS